MAATIQILGSSFIVMSLCQTFIKTLWEALFFITLLHQYTHTNTYCPHPPSLNKKKTLNCFIDEPWYWLVCEVSCQFHHFVTAITFLSLCCTKWNQSLSGEDAQLVSVTKDYRHWTFACGCVTRLDSSVSNSHAVAAHNHSTPLLSNWPRFKSVGQGRCSCDPLPRKSVLRQHSTWFHFDLLPLPFICWRSIGLKIAPWSV